MATEEMKWLIFYSALQDLESDGMIEARFMRTGIYNTVRAAFNIEITRTGRALSPDRRDHPDLAGRATSAMKAPMRPMPSTASQQPSRITLDRAAPTCTTTGSASRVFISYSWDHEEHKKWVLALATQLRKDGIDVIIDHTHLSLGPRTTEFMERSVREK